MQLRTSAFMLIMALVGGLASTPAVADEMFLKFIGGSAGEILGDSTDPQHPSEIVLLSYSVGVEAETSWTKGGGASVGKPNPLELHFTAAMNRSIPTILKYITRGQAVPTAILTVRSDISGNRIGFEYAKYTFEGVFFTNVGQSLSGAGRAVNAVSAVYKTVQVQQFAPGIPTAVSCVMWDIPTGAVVDC
jgi:type VI secretion system secreted protein Hcp